MEYNAPYGSTDPDAAYVDRSTLDGIQGSKVPARAVEHPQREILEVIDHAGLVRDAGDLAQLRKAIGIMIERVRVNLQIYPDVRNDSGKLTVTPVAPGLIRIPASQQFVMRGGKLVVTEVTDLVTEANRTYHLRWTEDDEFVLRNLSDVNYNPSGDAADEIDPDFDSDYDDAFFARVVTDGSNVATITTLVNRPAMVVQTERRDELASALDWTELAGSSTTLNWARTPAIVYFALNEFRSSNVGPNGVATGEPAGIIRAIGMRVPEEGRTRYGIPALEYYYEDTALNQGTGSSTLLIQAPSQQV